MRKTNLILTVILQIICWSIIINFLVVNQRVAQASTAYQVTTPQPFLGSIYYNQEAIWQVFDHDLPGNTTNNEYVMHYNGTPYYPVTPAPPPGTTPTPGPPPEPSIPDGYGYNGHLGVDYSLIYEPVLAAASGSIVEAGWDNSANHRTGYGLHVEMNHAANTDYQTWYGHLSALTVKQGDNIVISSSDPGNRSRIIGISGNTGNVFGAFGTCPDISGDPDSLTCGQHLHFEVRTNNTANLVANPYGWIGGYPNGTPIPDPWATPGVPSYNLWATRPAVTTDQYGSGGAALDEPIINDTRMIIDNSSADFIPTGSCWATPTGNASFNNEYRQAPANNIGVCKAKWSIVPDAFSPPDNYDIWVHIPDAANTSLSAVYTIKYNAKQFGEAVVVQAAYPNENHNAWAYLGRYDLEMTGGEEVQLSVQTLLSDPANQGNSVLADAIRLAPATVVVPPVGAIFTSFDTSGLAGGVFFEDEDILQYNTHTGEWAIYFDGSDMSLIPVNIDAFYLMGDGSILLSFDLEIALPGIGTVYDSDIVQFTPISLGDDTNGTFTMYREAESLGLNVADNNHDIDAISFTPSGALLISIKGVFGNFADADLLQEVAGTPPLDFYFDGSDVGLTTTSEGVDGAWADGSKIYLSTKGVFSVLGSSGDGADIFVCTPGSTGSTTTCTFGWEPGIKLFWNGSAHGLMKDPSTNLMKNVDSFFLGSLVNCPPPNCGFELQFVSWSKSTDDPLNLDWLLSPTEPHTGLYSAQATVWSIENGEDADLVSSMVSVNDQGPRYRFSFYGKGALSQPGHIVQVFADVFWYSGGVEIGSDVISDVDAYVHTDWTLFVSNDLCPEPGADSVKIHFRLFPHTLLGNEALQPFTEVGSIYIDDVLMETIDGNSCPLLSVGD